MEYVRALMVWAKEGEMYLAMIIMIFLLVEEKICCKLYAGGREFPNFFYRNNLVCQKYVWWY